MKVVLKQDVKSIGKKDELHEVSDGYARNYLLPRGLAVGGAPAARPPRPPPPAAPPPPAPAGRGPPPARIMQRRSWPTRRRWPKS